MSAQPMPQAAEDTAEISAIPLRMVDAWNGGDARGFAAPFAEDADFVAFEGTHLIGREAIESFHQPLFETVLKGTRLAGEVRFVRVLAPEWAVMHAWASVTLAGEDAPSLGRNSMQLFVVTRGDAGWQVVAMQNSREVTPERQAFLDDVDSLSPEEWGQVSDFVTALARP